MAVILAVHLVADLPAGHWRAEVIAGADLGRERLAQADLGRGGLHGHFELRLAVLLDSELACPDARPVAAAAVDLEDVHAQRGLLTQGQLAADGAVLVGGQRVTLHRVALGIRDDDVNRPPREWRQRVGSGGIGHRRVGPDAELDLGAGAVHRAIGDDILPFIQAAEVVRRVPLVPVLEHGECHALAFGQDGGVDRPLVDVPAGVLAGVLNDPVGVGGQDRLVGVPDLLAQDRVVLGVTLVHPDHLVAQRFTGAGVHRPDQPFLGHHLVDHGDVADQHDEPAWS